MICRQRSKCRQDVEDVGSFKVDHGENLRLVVERENSFRKEAATTGLSFPINALFSKESENRKVDHSL